MKFDDRPIEFQIEKKLMQVSELALLYHLHIVRRLKRTHEPARAVITVLVFAQHESMETKLVTQERDKYVVEGVYRPDYRRRYESLKSIMICSRA